MKQLEHIQQQHLMRWAKLSEGKYPMLELLFAIPNGGQRSLATAVKLKAEGVKAGVPDLFLPYPNNKYHGLFIEMKIKGNKPTALQRDWLAALAKQGYHSKVCYDSQEAIDTILAYLNSDDKRES